MTHTPKDEGRDFDGAILRIFDAGHQFETLSIRWLRGAKHRTTTRIKPTPGEKACGFPAFRGLSAAPLGKFTGRAL